MTLADDDPRHGTYAGAMAHQHHQTRAAGVGMSADPFLDLTRSLAVERRQPTRDEPATRELRDLSDLREVIHILAKAMLGEAL